MLAEACDIAGQVVELGKDITLLTQLLVGLDGGEEVSMLVVHRATAAVKKRRRQAETVGKVQYWCQFERDEVVVVGSSDGIRFSMLMIVVGSQRQFPRTSLPIDGVPEAQLHAVGARQMTIPVALQTGVKDKILLLVRIAHHSLMVMFVL